MGRASWPSLTSSLTSDDSIAEPVACTMHVGHRQPCDSGGTVGHTASPSAVLSAAIASSGPVLLSSALPFGAASASTLTPFPPFSPPAATASIVPLL